MNRPPGVVLDAGVFIALERRKGTMVALARLLIAARTPLVTSAGVVAQVWRGGRDGQVPITCLLRRTTVVALDYPVARLLGRMMGARGTSDPVDAHLVHLARERSWPVLTSDPEDLRALDPTLHLELL